MTKRQKIASVFIALAKTITAANGYLSNFAEDEISHWQNRTLDKDETQYLDFKDGINEHIDDEGVLETMEIKFEFGFRGTDLHTNITNMVQSVYKVIYDNQTSLETTFGYFRILPVEDDIEINFDKAEQIAEGHVTFEATHSVTNKWQLDETVYT